MPKKLYLCAESSQYKKKCKRFFLSDFVQTVSKKEIVKYMCIIIFYFLGMKILLCILLVHFSLGLTIDDTKRAPFR